MRALARLLDEPGLYPAMVANGTARGADFTVKATLQRWQRLLAQLAAICADPAGGRSRDSRAGAARAGSACAGHGSPTAESAPPALDVAVGLSSPRPGSAQGVALVGPLVLRRVARGDTFDRGVERRTPTPGAVEAISGGAGATWTTNPGGDAPSAAGRRSHRANTTVAPLRAAERGSKVMVSAGMPKNGANSPSPLLGCWSGRIPTTPPSRRLLQQLAHAADLGAHLGDARASSVGAHPLQEGLAHARFRRRVQGSRSASSSPATGSAVPSCRNAARP